MRGRGHTCKSFRLAHAPVLIMTSTTLSDLELERHIREARIATASSKNEERVARTRIAEAEALNCKSGPVLGERRLLHFY